MRCLALCWFKLSLSEVEASLVINDKDNQKLKVFSSLALDRLWLQDVYSNENMNKCNVELDEDQ